MYWTFHSAVRWRALCSSDTLHSVHHKLQTIRCIHRVDRVGNPRIPPDSGYSGDPSPPSDTHTDL